MRRLLFVLAIAGCGVRMPPRVDVDAILRAKGPALARFDLEAAVLAAPRDVGAHLALAALADKLGRPSEAIEQLEIVGNLGGPLGIRWRAEDRARLARLIAARGEARLARGSASAAADLERARSLGAAVGEAALRRAHVAAAIVDLRHVDAAVRARGKRTLAFVDEPQWHGARPNATLAERGAFGVWLWTVGAKRGAWEELSAWHAGTPAPRDPALESAFVTARTWWTPPDAPPPPAAELAGPERCRFGACTAAEVAASDDPAELHALLASHRREPSTDPREVVAWVQLGLRAALRGQGSWGRVVRDRVDVEAIAAHDYAGIPAGYRPILARIAARPVPLVPLPAPGATATDRLVIAAEQLLAGVHVDKIRATLDPAAPDAAALLALVAPRAPVAAPLDTAIARATAARIADRGLTPDGSAAEGRRSEIAAPAAEALAPIIAAFHRDPAIAERLGRDLVARASDAAAAHAALGSLFGALGDPARARLAWQAAVDASPEPAFFQGLAEAEARAGDPDAALVAATTATAASGDPGAAWLAIAHGLDEAGTYPQALEAARSAIDLATADTLDTALDIAIDASQALGRDVQVAQLENRHLDAPHLYPDDPTDAFTALAAYRLAPSSGTLAHLWVASRWNPRDVASRAAILGGTDAGDPRHTAVVAELVALAGDRALAAEALRALEPQR